MNQSRQCPEKLTNARILPFGVEWDRLTVHRTRKRKESWSTLVYLKCDPPPHEYDGVFLLVKYIKLGISHK